MTVAVKATEQSVAVEYQHVIVLAMNESNVSIIQQFPTSRVTQSFDMGYSVTITA